LHLYKATLDGALLFAAILRVSIIIFITGYV